MATWQINEAKNRFSQLLEAAQGSGPQIITRHGTERAVVLSIHEYRALKGKNKDFLAHLLGGPKMEGFSIERNPDTGREIDLEKLCFAEIE